MGRRKLSTWKHLVWTVFADCVLRAAVCLAAAAAVGGEEGQVLPQLVSIRDVLADVNAPARRFVMVRGVVIWRVGSGLIMQDESGGIWVDTFRDAPQPITLECDPAILERLAPGLEIEVIGWTNRGGFSPNILPATIRILETKPEPEPRPLEPERFFSGADDCMRVRVECLIQGVRENGSEWQLAAETVGRRFTAVVPKWVIASRPDHLVDAKVGLVGVAATQFNTRGEHRGTRLLIAHANDVAIVQPAVGTPFEAKEVPLHAIAQYAPDPTDGHRIRTQGIVTFSEPGRFLYLQAGMMGVRVETSSVEPFALGDVVQAAGFVDRSREVAGLVEAVVRPFESGRPLMPIRIAPDAIVAINKHASYHGAVAAPGDYKGALVTFPARVMDVQTTAAGGTLLMQSGSTTVVAVVGTGPFQGVRGVEPGSEVQVTGIVSESVSSDDAATIVAAVPRPQVHVFIRLPADLKVLRVPSWWKPHRLAAALLMAATVAGIAIGWVVLLRRQVARQMGLLETTLQAEATAEERQRIAREFHDSLEQGLAGLSLRLDVAAHEAGDERTRGVLRQQRQLLGGLQTEARGFLWDLRDPVHVEGSLMESIAAQLRLLQPLSAAAIVLDAAGSSTDVAPAVQYQLVRIVREAVTNAIRHARARRIDVGVRLEEKPGDPDRVCLTVADDGEGFDIESRSAVEGHYGLRGMRERARRIGAEFAVESGPGCGTRIVATVPVRAETAGLGNGEPAGSSA
jgi:signal transduction histidine kinase